MTKNNAVLAAIMLISSSAFAAEEATATMTNMAGWTTMGGWIAVATGLAISIAVLGGAFGQGRAAAAALEGVARNPQASGKLLLPLILSLALIESLVIYALVIAFQLNTQLSTLTKMIGH